MPDLEMFKIAVSAFIVKEHKLLILKRGADESFLPNTWEVPGGGIDQGEKIEAGVVRETMEEAGISIVPQKLLGFFEYVDGFGLRTVNLNFFCTMRDPAQEIDVSSGEMERAAWVGLDEFAGYTFTSAVMLQACKEALQGM